jgi:hypothetical protein
MKPEDFLAGAFDNDDDDPVATVEEEELEAWSANPRRITEVNLEDEETDAVG